VNQHAFLISWRLDVRVTGVKVCALLFLADVPA
jgi:hypothetical protein